MDKKVITTKTQRNAENARGNRMWQLGFNHQFQISKFVEMALCTVFERNRLLPPAAYLKENNNNQKHHQQQLEHQRQRRPAIGINLLLFQHETCRSTTLKFL